MSRFRLFPALAALPLVGAALLTATPAEATESCGNYRIRQGLSANEYVYWYRNCDGHSRRVQVQGGSDLRGWQPLGSPQQVAAGSSLRLGAGSDASPGGPLQYRAVVCGC